MLIQSEEYHKFTRWYRRRITRSPIPLPVNNPRLQLWVRMESQGYVEVDIPVHLRNATSLTKFGHRDMINHKSSRAAEKYQRDVKSARYTDVIIRQSDDNMGVATQ